MSTRVLNVKLVKSGLPNDTVFILGSLGSGKTTLIANLALERERFIIVDTKEDFTQEFFPDAVFAQNIQELRTELNRGTKRIIIQLWKMPNPDDAFEQICGSVYNFHLLNSGKVESTFILDETNKFVYVNTFPQSFQDIVLRGRSIGIRKIFGAQWFGTIPTVMRDTFTEIYTFRHVDESGVDRLEQFGFDAETVMNLPQYNCMYSGKNKLETISLVPSKSSGIKTNGK